MKQHSRSVNKKNKIMSKNTLIIIIVIAIVVIAGIVLFSQKKSEDLPEEIALQENISEITDEQIVELLKENKDSLSFVEKNKDFKIQFKAVLTKESILKGQEGSNFKEVYQDLSLEDNRYIRVDLINALANKGLIAVIDTKTKTVLKVFGKLLIKGGVKVKE